MDGHKEQREFGRHTTEARKDRLFTCRVMRADLEATERRQCVNTAFSRSSPEATGRSILLGRIIVGVQSYKDV